MNRLRKISRAQLIVLLLVPLAAYAVSWSMNGSSAPKAFRQAASALGLRVTEVCRPHGTKRGAKNSAHHTCRAMDIGAETSRADINGLAKYGLCAQYHKKGYFGATGNHYHVVQCSTGASRAAARTEQRARAQTIRANNRVTPPKTSSRGTAAKRQRQKVAGIRNANRGFWWRLFHANPYNGGSEAKR